MKSFAYLLGTGSPIKLLGELAKELRAGAVTIDLANDQDLDSLGYLAEAMTQITDAANTPPIAIIHDDTKPYAIVLYSDTTPNFVRYAFAKAGYNASPIIHIDDTKVKTVLGEKLFDKIC
ncbi:MAG: hypothetical protein V1870_05280 [Candidatus Aenigmatarchaeota archaeon]